MSQTASGGNPHSLSGGDFRGIEPLNHHALPPHSASLRMGTLANSLNLLLSISKDIRKSRTED
ncbi:hypothetical protein [Cyanothece sp. BG0011]|uniref:hypothetical protein n=1 Tax=Cyanothece sp. BG0011 TaxID=2082950 RepID=UPI0030DD4994